MTLFKAQSVIRSLLACILLGSVSQQTTSASDYQLPELGSASSTVLSPLQEKRLGQAFMRSVKASQKFIDEPFVQIYIEQLGNRLAQASGEDAARDFNFFIIDNPSINAFAGPAGNVGVFSGLIMTTQSESELAAVVAHEIAHVTQNHLIRTFHNASQLSLPSAAVLLAAIVLGASVGGDAALATAMTGQAALMQNQINFTRSNEQEADRVGIQTLADAEFEPHAMPLFFERMSRKNRTYASEIPEFLRTHPVTTNRIADSLARADQYPYQQNRETLDYHLVKSLIQLRNMVNPQEAEKFFRTNLDEGRYRNRHAQQFGLVLALMAQQRFDAAEKQLTELLQTLPDETVFHIYASRIKAETGRLQSAITDLEKVQARFPENYSVNLQLAALYTDAGQFAKAVELLQFMTLIRPYDDTVFRQLAIAAGKNGQLADAHAFQADHLYLNGQVEAAIKQLEIALRQPGLDFYQASRLEARLDSLQAEFKLIQESKNR